MKYFSFARTGTEVVYQYIISNDRYGSFAAAAAVVVVIVVIVFTRGTRMSSITSERMDIRFLLGACCTPHTFKKKNYIH